jgi:hypothetical protein
MHKHWHLTDAAITAIAIGFLATACADESRTSPVGPSTPVRAPSLDRGASGPPSTLQWNAEAIALVGKAALRVSIANRAYMLLSVAEARALDALDAAPDGSDDVDQGVASREAALGGAAAVVLAYIFPADQAGVAGMLASLRAGAPNAEHFAAAVAVGRAAGQRVVDDAKTDGSDAVVVPIIPVGPQYWKSAGNILTPQWPFVRPMLMTSGSQFRPGPPPAFGSPEYLAALQRVRTFSDTRTPEQLAIVNFWFDPVTVGQHAGHWNRIAVDLIVRHHLNERSAVHVLESLNLAISDASIACMDAKYTYWFVRPYQADPLITTPIGQPGHPAYPSLHSCQGGAAVGVLEYEFPGDAESLEAMGAEMNLSREWAGLHYWFDTAVGTRIGHQVADLANARP